MYSGSKGYSYGGAGSFHRRPETDIKRYTAERDDLFIVSN